ncbi:hypothetical protein ACIBCT_38985 [Streptosporangium sp. NPDC050855]|uniref:hypothetical protein n=1 Tax=Streptosporangium sp. NPDC050855 TaxID=3366194 RepID=UPI003794205C
MTKNKRKGFDDLIARREEFADVSPPWTTPEEQSAGPDDEALRGSGATITRPEAVPAPYETAGTGELTTAERDDLAVCEAAIDSLRVAFWAAGKALQVIRDGGLYRATHTTFEAYLTDRWDMQTSQAYRLIQAWPLAERLSPIGDKINEAQVRELVPLAERHGLDAAVTVYQTVVETDGVKVTAATLKGALSVLPRDRFDAGEAVEEIRAYLAGQSTPPEPPAVTAAELWTIEAGRVRTALQRIRKDGIRTAAAERPEEARQLAAELRRLADEMEQGL